MLRISGRSALILHPFPPPPFNPEAFSMGIGGDTMTVAKVGENQIRLVLRFFTFHGSYTGWLRLWCSDRNVTNLLA